jgi:ABC-type lipoprotein export system ATPase subunit
MEEKSLLEINNVYKSYRLGKNNIEVLKGVNFVVRRGSWTALLGASGSGKTTLLNILGTLERPDRGEVIYEDMNYRELSSRGSNRFRNKKIGFIFQTYHMLPELTILQNVMMPGMLNRIPMQQLKEKAVELLEHVGLAHRLKHRPNELSGGEQQRAAIARALINSPELILADEPTGNLDSHTGAGILEIFQKMHQQKDAATIIMITHSHEVAALADEIIHLQDGVISC